MDEITQIKEMAQSQLDTARAEVDRRRKQLAEAEASLDQLKAVVKIFNSGKKPKPQRKKAKQVSGKTQESVNQVQMMKACKSLVADNQPIIKADLETLAMEKVRSEYSVDLKGAAMRFRECMNSKNFIIDDKEMVSLAAKQVSPNNVPTA